MIKRLKHSAPLFACLFVFFTYSCKHDPFPAPPPGSGNNPNDTAQNPIDTGQGQNTKPCHPDSIYYERDVQPILSSNCALSGCHDDNSAQKGVILSNYNSVITTGDVRAGNLSGSDLFEVITDSDPDKRMPPPPAQALNSNEIDVIRKWILQGALNLTCDDCDTTNLTYSGKISQIFQSNCVNCHSGSNPNGGRSLTNYSEVSDALLNSNLLKRIRAESGVPVMPPAGKMNECSVKQIEVWFNEGMIQ